MKLLISSHAYVSPENRTKLELLSKKCELLAIFPKRWQTKHGEEVEFRVKSQETRYKILAPTAFFSGDGGKFFYNPISLFRAISRFKPDVVHVEEEPWTPVMLEFVLAFKLLKFLRLLKSGARFSFFTWENLDLPLGWWRSFFEKTTFVVADLVICGSKEVVERIRKRGFKGQVEILPQFGVDLEVFKRSSDDEIKKLKKVLGLRDRVIGFVGRFVEEKGLDTLIEALSEVGKEYQLLLVSTSPELPVRFKEMARDLGVIDRIVVAANIPHKDLAKYYSLMDVFVLPSKTTAAWKEQFGRVLIEAMACGVPVVGSSSGAIPEVVGEAGLIFEEGSEVDLVKEIRQISNDTKSYSKRSLSLVEEKYSLSVVVGKLIKVLELKL